MGGVDPAVILAGDPQTIYVACVICRALKLMYTAKTGGDAELLKAIARSKTSSAVKACRKDYAGAVSAFPSISYHFTYWIASLADSPERLRELVEILCGAYQRLEERLFAK